MYEIENLFTFVKEDNYEEFIEIVSYFDFVTSDNRKKALEIYRNFILKYNSKEISPEKFMLALSSTRIIEYYNGIIDNFDIEDIKEATRKRSCIQKSKSIKDKNIVKKVLEMFGYEITLEDTLEALEDQIKPDIEKRKLNIRLLKVLRNKQK